MRRRRDRRRIESSPVSGFPVTPMLDMAFQLLAFFILSFQAPTREARIDLYLPAVAAALPEAGAEASAGDPDADRLVIARADPKGSLWYLTLDGRTLANADVLEDRLRTARQKLGPKPLRVAVVADDLLRYEEAARILGACSAAGVDAIRLAQPEGAP